MDQEGGSLARVGDLVIWTIYKNPSDYPGQTVARKFLNNKPTGEVIVDSIENLRGMFYLWGLTGLTRVPQDDPVIVETWL